MITVLWVLQYRLRADCSRTVRWFSAPGKLLRMDGRVQAEAGEKLHAAAGIAVFALAGHGLRAGRADREMKFPIQATRRARCR